MNKRRVLYIDDEPINLKLFEIAFKKVFDVKTESNPILAIENMEQDADFDVVIVDMSMPEMSGIEFLKKVTNQYIKPKYMVLTGYLVSDEIDQAQKEGLFSICERKPYKKEELEDKIINLANESSV